MGTGGRYRRANTNAAAAGADDANRTAKTARHNPAPVGIYALPAWMGTYFACSKKEKKDRITHDRQENPPRRRNAYRGIFPAGGR